jgi:hypothetical protein
VGWRFSWRFGAVGLGLGAEVGPALVLQNSGTQTAAGPAGIAAPRLSVRVLLGGPVVLSVEGEPAVALYGTGSAVGVAFRPSGTVGLGFRF